MAGCLSIQPWCKAATLRRCPRRSPNGSKPTVSFPLETLSSLGRPSARLVDSTGRLTDDLVANARSGRRPIELFAKLFDSLLVFVYHCFDRIVIHGYLSGLSRPEQVVYFFRDVVGVPVVDKTALSHTGAPAAPS